MAQTVPCLLAPARNLKKSFSLLIAFIRHFGISNLLSHLDLMVLQLVSLEIVLLDSPYHSAIFLTSLSMCMRYASIGAQLISLLSTKKVPHMIQGITDQYHSCCRAMEQVINKDILNYLQANNLISPDQHGFLSMRSTCTNLIECTNDWSTAMQLHQGTDIIYFDFKKAFDSVSHQKLLTKLQAYGISDNLFLWITKFLSNRTQVMKMNGQLSSNGDVTSGVPQGNVLGPTLFLIYINDVVDTFTDKSVKYKLFADDIKFYSRSSSPHNSSLPIAIDRLVLWSEKWQLQLAPEKCLQALRTLPYRSRLQKLGLQTLEHRRLIHDLCLCHKILHEFIHCTIPKLFMSSRTRGHTLRLRQEKCSTTHRLHFLINRTLELSAPRYYQLHSRFKACFSNTDLTKYLII